MAKTIANFLVGIGLDTKDFDKGSRSVDTSLSGFRSKAQLAGGALAAAFGAASMAAINAGNKSDEFMRKVAKFDTAPRFIYNLGNAFRLMGGNAEDAINTIAKAEGVLDALRKGDASALEAAGLAQVDVSRLQTSRDGEELLKNLSDILSSPNTQDWQKRSLQETFGLSDEGLVLLSKGRAEIDAVVNGVDKYAEGLEKAAEAGRAYSEALAKIGIQFDYIGNVLADKILHQFTGLLNGVSDFLDRNMPRVGAVADYLSDNSGAVAAIGGGLATAGVAGTGASIAAKLGMKGLSTVGRGAAFGGGVGAAVGAGSLLWDLKASDIKEMTGYDVGKYYRSPSETWDAIRGGWGGKEKPLHDAEVRQGVSKNDAEVRQGVLNSANSKPAIREYAQESIPNAWWRNGVADQDEAAAISPSAQAARKPSLSEMARSDASVPPPIVIENKLMLNEREIAKTIRKVNAEDNYNAYTEVVTTESR